MVTTLSRNLVIAPTAAGGNRILPCGSRSTAMLASTCSTVTPPSVCSVSKATRHRRRRVRPRRQRRRSRHAGALQQSSELACDTQDNPYVADQSGTVVRKGRLLGLTPSITTQPSSQSGTAGSAVTLSVVATGDPAPTYQWQRDGASLAGATSASYTIASLGSANTGAYTVIVTNAAGSVTSNTANVSIAPSGGGNGGGSGGGGGGAPSTWFLGLLAIVLARARPAVTPCLDHGGPASCGPGRSHAKA